MKPSTVMARKQHLIIWDGDCGLCATFIRLVERHDRRRQFTAAPWQICSDKRLDDETRLRCRDAVHVIASNNEVFAAGRAVLFILHELSGWTVFKFAQSRGVIWLFELVYRVVALNRHRISRVAATLHLFPACTIRTVDQKVAPRND